MPRRIEGSHDTKFLMPAKQERLDTFRSSQWYAYASDLYPVLRCRSSWPAPMGHIPDIESDAEALIVLEDREIVRVGIVEKDDIPACRPNGGILAASFTRTSPNLPNLPSRDSSRRTVSTYRRVCRKPFTACINNSWRHRDFSIRPLPSPVLSRTVYSR